MQLQQPFECVIVGSEVGSCPPVPMTTLNEASIAYRAFCDANFLGASGAGRCLIKQGGKTVAHVSYNGRVWEGNGRKFNPDAKPIFDPRQDAETCAKTTGAFV